MMEKVVSTLVSTAILSSCVNVPVDLKNLEGQSLANAIQVLGEKNYGVNHPIDFNPEFENCESMDTIGLMNLRDPSHYIALEVDKDCEVLSASSHVRNVP